MDQLKGKQLSPMFRPGPLVVLSEARCDLLSLLALKTIRASGQNVGESGIL